jgi:hypothetical protein
VQHGKAGGAVRERRLATGTEKLPHAVIDAGHVERRRHLGHEKRCVDDRRKRVEKLENAELGDQIVGMLIVTFPVFLCERETRAVNSGTSLCNGETVSNPI